MDPATPTASHPPSTVVTVANDAANAAAASTASSEPPSSTPASRTNRKRHVHFADATPAKRSNTNHEYAETDPSHGGSSPSIDRFVPSLSSSPLATPNDAAADGAPTSSTQTPEEVQEVLHESNLATDSSSATATAAPVRRSPPPLVPLNEIPPNRVRMIKEEVIQGIFGIETPRDFQIEAIHHTCFEDDTCLIVYRRTADGKSLVTLATAAIRGGVVIVLVPLLGLGSDQVEKTQFTDHNIEAYHIDEHKGEHATRLRRRLEGLDDEEAENVSIILFVSPQGLLNWMSIFTELARRGYISSFVIDEAHTIELCGRSFRPAFVQAVQRIPMLIKLMPHPVPRILLSATFLKKERDTCISLLGDSLLGDMEPNIIHGSLARRNTDLLVIISGEPSTTLKSSATRDLMNHPDKQQLWYCNSRTNAESTYLGSAETLLEMQQNLGSCLGTSCDSFTGGDGIMRKAFLMDAFTNFRRDDTVMPDGNVRAGTTGVALPRVQILCATAAAQCGISSDDLSFVKYKGFPANLHDAVQVMGRADRRLNALPGMSSCEFHVAYTCYVSMFVRIMQNDDPAERKRLLMALHEELRILVTPQQCYHTAIENHFELDPPDNKPGCGNRCTFCKGEHLDFTGYFHRKKLESLLSTKFSVGASTLSPSSLTKKLKAVKETLFAEGHVPKTNMGPIHALALQLIAKGMVVLNVSDPRYFGSKKLSASKHLSLSLGYTVDEDGDPFPTYAIDSSWSGLATVDARRVNTLEDNSEETEL